MKKPEPYILAWSEMKGLTPDRMTALNHYIRIRAVYAKELSIIDQLPATDERKCREQIEKCNRAMLDFLGIPWE